jgi:hypothetical protein
LVLTAIKFERKKEDIDIIIPVKINGIKNLNILKPEDFTGIISLFLFKNVMVSRVDKRADNGSTL